MGYAFADKCRDFLPLGKLSPAFIFLQIDPSRLDINVQPAKKEIKFSREKEVHDFISRAARETLRKSKSIPEIKIREDREGRIRERVAKYLSKETASPSELFNLSTQPKLIPLKKNISPLILLVQFENNYIISREKGKLVIFDQYAAHERILYERFKERVVQSRIEFQVLLFPISLELTRQEAALLYRELSQTEHPYTCLHGRLTMVELTLEELEKRFGRK